jgi:hypothetical protein
VLVIGADVRNVIIYGIRQKKVKMNKNQFNYVNEGLQIIPEISESEMMLAEESQKLYDENKFLRSERDEWKADAERLADMLMEIDTYRMIGHEDFSIHNKTMNILNYHNVLVEKEGNK